MALEREAPLVTFAEYQALPEGSYNLIDGVLIVTPAPTLHHQIIQIRLIAFLYPYVRTHRLGIVCGAPCDVVLREADPAIVVQPDVLFVARIGRARLTKAGIDGPPDLAVEILSPGSVKLDSVKKRQLYATYGVREYWMVLPDLEQVEVLRQAGEGAFARPILLEAVDMLTTPLLPDFSLSLTELFEPEEQI